MKHQTKWRCHDDGDDDGEHATDGSILSWFIPFFVLGEVRYAAPAIADESRTPAISSLMQLHKHTVLFFPKLF